MAENCVLRRVCEEPLLFAFAAPRTIASTLHEYESHLRRTPGLRRQHVRATVEALRDLLDPIEAPLVALTPALARSLVQAPPPAAIEQARPAKAEQRQAQRTVLSAWRFFRWAEHQGYVGRNPFEPLLAGLPAASSATPSTERTTAARGWVA